MASLYAFNIVSLLRNGGFILISSVCLIKKRDKKCSKTSVPRITHFILLRRNGDISCNSVFFVPILNIVLPILHCIQKYSRAKADVVIRIVDISIQVEGSDTTHATIVGIVATDERLGYAPLISTVYICSSKSLLFSTPLSASLIHLNRINLSWFWNFCTETL